MQLCLQYQFFKSNECVCFKVLSVAVVQWLRLFCFVWLFKHFYDGGPCDIESSSLICSLNQWTGFHMIGIFIVKELRRMLYCYNFEISSIFQWHCSQTLIILSDWSQLPSVILTGSTLFNSKCFLIVVSWSYCNILL